MKKIYLVLIVAVLTGTIAITSFLITANNMQNDLDVVSMPNENEPLFWVAPMDSNYRRDAPGLSPMGMALIPVYSEANNDNYTTKISSAIQQNLGLRTAEVIREDFSQEISAVGYTRWNESSIQMLHSRADGWLEVFNLGSVGDKVLAGQIIYELFAPNLVSAQREYLTARQSSNATLATAGRDRLLALGFTGTQIDELNRSGEINQRLIFRADQDAIITDIGARKGDFVQPQSNIATLASLDTIWVDAEVFENDAGMIEPGLSVMLTLLAYPGESWESEIAYVYPELDPVTRTLQLRLVIDNQDQRLKPNMFANVVIQASARPDVLTVPREAVIRSGTGSRVILALDDGVFQVKSVITGISSAGRTEILDGLNEGDIVVSSGQFLIDSEANGEQALARLTGANAQELESPESEDMPEIGVMNMPEEAMEIPVSFFTTGTIIRITDSLITVSHAPVEALSWPSMTMGFEFSEDISLSDFNVNDAVSFNFEQVEGGMYRIISLQAESGNAR